MRRGVWSVGCGVWVARLCLQYDVIAVCDKVCAVWMWVYVVDG